MQVMQIYTEVPSHPPVVSPGKGESYCLVRSCLGIWGMFFLGHKYSWIVFKVEVDQCKVRNV